MDKLLDLLADFLKGQSVATSVRRLLNLMFTVSLTSFLFVRFVGPYSLDDLLSTRYLIEAFVSGAYLIPVGLFAISHYLIEWSAVALFHGLNYGLTVALSRWLGKQEWTQPIVRLWLRRIYWFSRFTPRPLTSEQAQQVLLEVKRELTLEVLHEIKSGLATPMKTVEVGFILLFRVIVTLTAYAGIVPGLSGAFYWTVVCVFMFAMVIGIVGVTILKVLPAVLARFRQECDMILAIVQRGLKHPVLQPTPEINRLTLNTSRSAP